MTPLDEIVISRAIIETYHRELIDNLDCQVAIAGAGPSGLCCAYYLAKEGFKTVVLERALRVGGGMPGGGMMFNKIVIQEESKEILDELGVKTIHYKDEYYTASALETLALLTARAIQVGSTIFNLIAVEDVMIRAPAVVGLVINWSAVEMANLHVDPLTLRSRAVVDATGHQAEVVRVVERKMGAKLFTPTGGVRGERPMWAEAGERTIVENSREVYHNLFVCGMAANAVFGSPRMGPIFGGMLLSGRRVAELVAGRLQKGDTANGQKTRGGSV